MNFREQIAERLRVSLGEKDVPPGAAEAFAADVVHLLGRLIEDRGYEAVLRQILQWYAEEYSEQASRRVLEGKADSAADLVYEMIARQGRNRAVRALHRALMDAIEGRERPPDDVGLFDEE